MLVPQPLRSLNALCKARRQSNAAQPNVTLDNDTDGQLDWSCRRSCREYALRGNTLLAKRAPPQGGAKTNTRQKGATTGIELCTDVKRRKECDGGLSVAPQSPQADMPFVDVLFQGHRGFYDQFHKSWDLKRKRYLLASTNDPEWLRTGLRLLKAAWQMRTARVCVVTDEAGAADTVHPQLGTTFHPVPPKRLEEEIRKVSLPGSEPLLKRRRDARSMSIREAFPGKVDPAARNRCIGRGGSTR